MERLTEHAEDSVKTREMEICKAVASRKIVTSWQTMWTFIELEDSGKEKKSRPVIIRFTSRTARGVTWKGAKGNDFLKKNKMYFKEDLMIKDRATRNLLWTSIDKARKEGKRAFFVGIKAIIDGKEIKM